MRCCRSMHCSSHGHHQGRDCCKSMSENHPSFVVPAAKHHQPSGHTVIAFVPESTESPKLDCPFSVVAAQCHAPPVSRAQASCPIRI